MIFIVHHRKIIDSTGIGARIRVEVGFLLFLLLAEVFKEAMNSLVSPLKSVGHGSADSGQE